jgi:diaminopimelate epimerase
MTIEFSKYQGTGNDFIIIDNRTNNINFSVEQVNTLCNRKFGIGADGLMLLNKSETIYDFEMVYFNADGKEGSMCGNGGRCLVQFAYDIGIVKENYLFIAVDGVHQAFIDKESKLVHLKMQDVTKVIYEPDDTFVLNTGSPHLIKMVKNIEGIDVFNEGKTIRCSENYKQEGINVNFVEILDKNSIQVRTYERGVEDETLSCGTGVTAAALMNANNNLGLNTVFIKTLGGNLVVKFKKENNQLFNNIWLCGPANFVFKGTIVF